jgi:hypothetical protein
MRDSCTVPEDTEVGIAGQTAPPRASLSCRFTVQALKCAGGNYTWNQNKTKKSHKSENSRRLHSSASVALFIVLVLLSSAPYLPGLFSVARHAPSGELLADSPRHMLRMGIRASRVTSLFSLLPLAWVS